MFDWFLEGLEEAEKESSHEDKPLVNMAQHITHELKEQSEQAKKAD